MDALRRSVETECGGGEGRSLQRDRVIIERRRKLPDQQQVRRRLATTWGSELWAKVGDGIRRRGSAPSANLGCARGEA